MIKKKNATNLKRKCDNDDLQEKNTCQKEKKNKARFQNNPMLKNKIKLHIFF